MSYAEGTTVAPEKSRAEIERFIRSFNAAAKEQPHIFSGEAEGVAFVQFRARGRMVRFEVRMPQPGEQRFTHTKDKWGFLKARSDVQARNAYEQELRRLWRALLLVIKARLESVESSIETFEEAFLAHVLLPDGSRVGQVVAPAIEAAYTTGVMPRLSAESTVAGEALPVDDEDSDQ